jgi:hypothetical protein
VILLLLTFVDGTRLVTAAVVVGLCRATRAIDEQLGRGKFEVDPTRYRLPLAS